MSDKREFSATKWKEDIEKEVSFLRKAVTDMLMYLNRIEQWRRMPLINQKEAEYASKEQATPGKSSKKRKRSKRAKANR